MSKKEVQKQVLIFETHHSCMVFFHNNIIRYKVQEEVSYFQEYDPLIIFFYLYSKN